MKCNINKLTSVFLVIIAFVLISCGDSADSEINEKLQGANRVNIYFYDKERGMNKDSRMMVEISNQGEIKKILESITDITSEQYKCGYSGQLEIFVDSKLLLESEFNFEDECKHYVFTYKNDVLFRVMTKEGSLLLKNYYKRVATD